MRRHAATGLTLVLLAIGCGGAGSPGEQLEAVVDLDPDDPSILMRPFSAEEIRDEWVPGFRLLMRRSYPERTLIERWTVVSADDEGVEIGFTSRSEIASSYSSSTKRSALRSSALVLCGNSWPVSGNMRRSTS